LNQQVAIKIFETKDKYKIKQPHKTDAKNNNRLSINYKKEGIMMDEILYNKEFLWELHMMSQLRHPNILL